MVSLGFCAHAQFPYTLQVFDQAVYYGMYEATVDEPVPAGAIRLSNSSYSRMLTDEQLDSFGNTLTMTVRLNPLCDNYDRIGNGRRIGKRNIIADRVVVASIDQANANA